MQIQYETNFKQMTMTKANKKNCCSNSCPDKDPKGNYFLSIGPTLYLYTLTQGHSDRSFHQQATSASCLREDIKVNNSNITHVEINNVNFPRFFLIKFNVHVYNRETFEKLSECFSYLQRS